MLNKSKIKLKLKENQAHINNYGVDMIGIFGSYAREEQNQNSDIDLLVSFKEGFETFNNFMNLYYFLEDIFKGFKVELVSKNGLNQYLEPIILNEVEYV
jgi:predicted nucleotidyltransferase